MKVVRLRRTLLLFSLILSLVFAPTLTQWSAAANAPTQQVKQRYAKSSSSSPQLEAHDHAGVFILRRGAGEVTCHDATPLEAQQFSAPIAEDQLHVLTDATGAVRTQAIDGLTLTLRGTQQLENNPQAKAAFMRAAETWMGLIKSPITVIMDVDFGTTRFGAPYEPGVLGATRTQSVGAQGLYGEVRQSLLDSTSSAEETEIYNALPQGSLPTSIGNTTNISGPSSIFRALEFLAPDANPASETPQIGAPPSVGFNSAFDYDFDPSDGIDADKIDFEGVALHEIGHVLGFASNVGFRELEPLLTLSVTPWDFYRFRPGIALGGFPTVERILSSGGEQVFFAGGQALALSTGRPDGTGGDGEQSSHWKDDRFGGGHIGVMDPTARDGERLTVTENDLKALEFMGHAVGEAPPPDEDVIALTSGVPINRSIAAPPAGFCTLDGIQYTIQVPSGAMQLKIDLNGMPDLDLFVRFNQPIAIQSGIVVVDFSSTRDGGAESITITPNSTPALQAGTYFIALGNCGDGAGNFTLTATVSMDGGGGGNPGTAPVINTLGARLDGDTLTLTGTATDADGDIVRATASILNEAGAELASTQELDVNFGATTTVNINLPLTGMNQDFVLAGVRARLVLIDTQGNRSAAATANFDQADAGAATLNKVNFDPSGVMIFKGRDLLAPVEIEINGDIVSPPLNAKIKGGGAKIKLPGTMAQLGLRIGVNRVRVRRNGAYSMLRLLTLQ